MNPLHRERHKSEGKYLREVVFGINDGLVSTLALVCGFWGALLSSSVILIGGVAEAIAGAISMALGAYLSAKSQREFYDSELARETYEVEEMPEAEEQEIREIYQKKGFTGKDLERAVKIITKDKDRWIRVMMEEELGFTSDAFPSPTKVGVVMGTSFVIGASVVLIPFFFLPSELGILASIIVSSLFLFAVGSLKTSLTGKQWWKSGIETLLIGVIASGVSYYAGVLLQSFAGGL